MSSPDFIDVDIPPSGDTLPDGEEYEGAQGCDWPGCESPAAFRNGRLQKRCDEHYRKRLTSSSSSSGSGRRSAATTEAALAAMDTAYNMLAVGFMLLSPEAAHTWASKVENLQHTNRLAFDADPKLARQVGKAAGKGGSALFYLTNGAAVLTSAAVIVNEQRAKRPPKPKKGNVVDGETEPSANGHATVPPGHPLRDNL